MTHLFQPLDFTVNSCAKNFMREKFADWSVKEGLDSGKDQEDIEVKMPSSIMKPMHAQWIIELYNELTSFS